MSDKKPMARWTLTIVADTGYEATSEGECDAAQYGAAIHALHHPAAQPVQAEAPCDGQVRMYAIQSIDTCTEWEARAFLKGFRAAERAHGIGAPPAPAAEAVQSSSPEIPDKSPALAVRLTRNQVRNIAREAHIANCLGKFDTYDLALADMVERAVWAANGLRGE